MSERSRRGSVRCIEIGHYLDMPQVRRHRMLAAYRVGNVPPNECVDLLTNPPEY